MIMYFTDFWMIMVFDIKADTLKIGSRSNLWHTMYLFFTILVPLQMCTLRICCDENLSSYFKFLLSGIIFVSAIL